MRTLVIAFGTILSLATSAGATMVFEQPPDPAGGVLVSSWYPPDGSDYDAYVYDSFQLATAQPITEVRWRGGYQYTGYGTVTDFSITFYESIAGGSQPHCGLPGDGDIFLAQYVVGGTAGQTPAGIFGGTTMYDYHYALSQPFQAAAGVRYWIQIEAYTAGLPFWGMCAGTGGNGTHFRYLRGAHQFSNGQRDAAFSLHTTAGPTYPVTTAVTPAGAGSTTGDGAYPPGSTATVTATANPGFGFVEWTEGGVRVSGSPAYTFTVTGSRNLVAHFTTAYTITTAAQPVLGGTTSGDGIYNAGSSVTVMAAPNPGWHFVNWTEFGTPVSASASYTFTATADRSLNANFTLDAGTVLFNFDNAPVHTSLPVDVSAGGLNAHLSATGSGFSIQYADAMGFTPAGFGGLCVYPNSVFPADLLVDFSAPLTAFSIMFSPQELGCDDSATMRATAYLDGMYAGANTAVASPPGTWPTGTLSVSAPGGFNRVVVHYDARPPTCQDWGPIFLADNMMVTLAPAASVASQAVPQVAPGVLAFGPNPCAAGTAIRYAIPRGGPVRMSIHDAAGRLVRTLMNGAPHSAGMHEVRWDGRDEAGRVVAPGVYLCGVDAGGVTTSGRIVVLPAR